MTAPRRRELARLARLAGLAAGLLLAGCVAPISLDGPAVAELPAPVPDWIGLRVSEADDGRRVELPVGDSVAVTLKVPSGAGLGWVLVGQPPTLAQTGRYSGPVWPPDAPGSAVTPRPLWQVFVFEARAPGEGEVVLELDGAGLGTRPRRLAVRIAVVPAR
ncbi:MAG: hypothetical protein EHM87_12755 [Burkholderiales bacterium]|nr:MAG: hypothetical protein EHM87_12755 [Burkholderiales bacterium]